MKFESHPKSASVALSGHIYLENMNRQSTVLIYIGNNTSHRKTTNTGSGVTFQPRGRTPSERTVQAPQLGPSPPPHPKTLSTEHGDGFLPSLGETSWCSGTLGSQSLVWPSLDTAASQCPLSKAFNDLPQLFSLQKLVGLFFT